MNKGQMILAMSAFFLAPLTKLNAEKPPKPNFVIINIDDLGYGDIGPYGSKLNRTPNLDRMASEGRLLTSFYAAPVCSPSRAALMTGCYPKRVLQIPGVLYPSDNHGLASEEITIAEILKLAGYSTCIIGKWHLGDQPDMLPTRQGFDEFFGLPYSNDMGPEKDGALSNFEGQVSKFGNYSDSLALAGKVRGLPPLPLMHNEMVIKRTLATDQTQLLAIYTNEALRFIRDHKKKPFFLYLAPNAVHGPLYPGDRFRGKSSNGLKGDLIEEVDWSVGEVIKALQTYGIARNTLVIFTSDNGGSGLSVNLPLRGYKGSTWEGGMRVPTIVWWPGKIPAGTSTDAICGMFDILPTFAALAGVKVGHKIDGKDISSLIFGEPGASSPHQFFFYFSHTLQLEAVRDSVWKLVILPEGENPIVNYYRSYLQVRRDHSSGKINDSIILSGIEKINNSKILSGIENGYSFQLFNLRDDIGESTNVAAQYPDVVERLKEYVSKMNGDLGISGIGPGCRPMGKVMNPKPLIGQDGTVRSGFEPKKREQPQESIY